MKAEQNDMELDRFTEEYYFKIDGSNERYGIGNYSLNEIEKTLIDNGIQDFISDLCGKNPAVEKIVGAGFKIDDIWMVKDYVNGEYSGKSVRIFDKTHKEVKTYSLSNLYMNLVEWYLSGESFDVEICDLWCKQLQNFIDKGSWHVAMEGEDGTIVKDGEDWPVPIKGADGKLQWKKNDVEYVPVMWYGLLNEKRLSEWTIGESGMGALVQIEDGMGDYGCQLRIQGLEINYGSMFDGDGFWYFGCCGNEGADFSKVMDSCPISLTDIYKDKRNGVELVEDYCFGMTM